jgi:hypothetical protein
MLAQHPVSVTARVLAILAVALAFAFVLASSAAKPANADSSQWTRSHPHWWDKSNGSGWSKPSHHRRHFKTSRPRVIIGGSGFVFSRPGFVIANPAFVNPRFVDPRFANPGFVVRQPPFIVQQPRFIVRQPGFVVGQPTFVVRQPNFIFQRPHFVAKQRDFFKRHPSLHVGQPFVHKKWVHKRWRPGRHPGGVHILAPGMD